MIKKIKYEVKTYSSERVKINFILQTLEKIKKDLTNPHFAIRKRLEYGERGAEGLVHDLRKY